MTHFRAWKITGCLCLALSAAGHAAVTVDLEAGAALSGYNTIRVPGTTGSRLSLTEDLDSEPALFWRALYSVPFKTRHMISFLIAPLTIRADGATDETIRYNGATFPAGTPLKARYRFDSYRARYRYYPRAFHQRLGFGAAVKIRDAGIRLSGGGQTTEKTNTGFVPLLTIILHLPLNEALSFVADADALAAPQGRAEDVLFALSWRRNERFSLKIGYRLLEGGADNDEVYTFALVHYMLIGASYTFY